MPDNSYDKVYCYPKSDVLINKLNIKSQKELFEAEKELTSIRLKELQDKPIQGKYDFVHLKAIHKYIFQDLYEWAGKERTVDIGKGNLFCTVAFIQEYAQSIFEKYYSQCWNQRNSIDDFVRVFAGNYGDLNALHPFREGNGRAQREFARIICLSCGYDFDLSCTTHSEMLAASQLSFNHGDSSGLAKIFRNAVATHSEETLSLDRISILTADDLMVDAVGGYDYYGYDEDSDPETIALYNEIYRARINKMEAEKL